MIEGQKNGETFQTWAINTLWKLNIKKNADD